MANSYFNIGDEVLCVGKEYDGNHDISMKPGTIIEIEDTLLTIQFLSPIKGGHAGLNQRGKAGHCWNVNINWARQNLIVLKEKPKEWKIGITVKCIQGFSKGAQGKIKHIGIYNKQGNKNSVWCYWNKENYLSYLDKELLKIV